MKPNLSKSSYRLFCQIILACYFLVGCRKVTNQPTPQSDNPPKNHTEIGLTPVTDEMIQLVENKLASFLEKHGLILSFKAHFLAKKLLAIKEKQADIAINEADTNHPYKFTAIHYAACLEDKDKQHGSLVPKILQALLDRGADINAQDKTKSTPLILAILKNRLEIVQYLVHHGANKELYDKDHMTPLIWAAAAGHLEIVKFLVENGANLHAQTCDGYTPLHYANANGHWEVAKFLRNKLCP